MKIIIKRLKIIYNKFKYIGSNYFYFMLLKQSPFRLPSPLLKKIFHGFI